MRTKLIILVSILLCTFSVDAQKYYLRTNGQTTPVDPRLGTYYSLKIPVIADTTYALSIAGIDSCGLIFKEFLSGKVWIRDTVLTGGHKWTLISPGSGGTAAWGNITGTLSAQTDLWTILQNKQGLLTTGTASQYFRGDLSLANFPTALSQFTNDVGFITSVTSTGGITGNGVSTPLNLTGYTSPSTAQYYGTPPTGGGTALGFYPLSSVGSGSSFSLHAIASSNFSTSTHCPIPALNNDSLQVFWNDAQRFLQEGTEWQNLSGGGFSILVPGFDATANSYSITLYANNKAYPPGPQNFTSANFTSSVNCPITNYNGMSITIYWNDAQRYLIQGTDWTPLAGGGFTMLVPGFDATMNSYSFYVFAQ